MKFPSISTRPLGNTGLLVSELGFGAAAIGNLYKVVSDQQATTTLDSAWQAGIRYFDTAPHYGQGLSERRVGDRLRAKNPQTYVLSTKVGRLLKPAGYQAERHGFCSPMPFDIAYDYSYDGIMRSFEDSQQRLGLDRIDILLIHDIGRDTHGDAHEALFKVCMDSGYKALDALRSGGQISAVGLGVNEYQVCEQAMAYGDFDCFLLAGRYTLLEQEALSSFLPRCAERQASVIIGGPYNSGILASGTRSGRTARYNYEPAPSEIIDRVRRIEAICEQYQVPLAAAALQFPLAHPAVCSVIPGMGSAEHIRQTLQLAGAAIDPAFWSELKSQHCIRQDAPVPSGGIPRCE